MHNTRTLGQWRQRYSYGSITRYSLGSRRQPTSPPARHSCAASKGMTIPLTQIFRETEMRRRGGPFSYGRNDCELRRSDAALREPVGHGGSWTRRSKRTLRVAERSFQRDLYANLDKLKTSIQLLYSERSLSNGRISTGKTSRSIGHFRGQQLVRSLCESSIRTLT
jgi:hypothetical protein